MMLRKLHRAAIAWEPIKHDIIARRDDEWPKPARKIKAPIGLMPMQHTLLKPEPAQKRKMPL
jgi:hypothetical protein